MENLELADKNARKDKSGQYGVISHDKNKEQNLLLLQNSLSNKTYTTSKYKTFTIFEPKERVIWKLPYFPDRICHHAIMQVVGSTLSSTLTSDTYSCIKGRGIHKASYKLRKVLKNNEVNTKYCLKLDIVKFYPNVDHVILKQLLRNKIKDKDMLWLLDNIIDSAPGLPIGNYLSQILANFLLTYFDHWLKEVKRIKYCFRYADDLVVLSDSKESLHQLLFEIKEYLITNLKLEVKGNYQIFPVSARGIDFVGYKHYHTHTLLRKGIKQNLRRMLKVRPSKASIASYNGWLKHCNSKNLTSKLLKHEDNNCRR